MSKAMDEHEREMQLFWKIQKREMEQQQAWDLKNQQVPLARIKKIMRAEEDVQMISPEAPVLLAKACELFIQELTLRSWFHAERDMRKTLQKNDIAAAITRTDIFDFLVDIASAASPAPDASQGLPPHMTMPLPADDVPLPLPLPLPLPAAVPEQPASVMLGSPAMQIDPWFYMQQQIINDQTYGQQQGQILALDGQAYGHQQGQILALDGRAFWQGQPLDEQVFGQNQQEQSLDGQVFWQNQQEQPLDEQVFWQNLSWESIWAGTAIP